MRALQFTAQFSLYEEVKYFVGTLSHCVSATEFGRQESSVQDERSGAQVIFPSPLPLFPAHFPSPLKTCFNFLCHIDKLFFKFLNRLFSLSFCLKNTCCSHIWSFQFKTLKLWTVALSLSSYQIFIVTFWFHISFLQIWASNLLSCNSHPYLSFDEKITLPHWNNKVLIKGTLSHMI